METATENVRGAGTETVWRGGWGGGRVRGAYGGRGKFWSLPAAAAAAAAASQTARGSQVGQTRPVGASWRFGGLWLTGGKEGYVAISGGVTANSLIVSTNFQLN
jgi:hypothetical protein